MHILIGAVDLRWVTDDKVTEVTAEIIASKVFNGIRPVITLATGVTGVTDDMSFSPVSIRADATGNDMIQKIAILANELLAEKNKKAVFIEDYENKLIMFQALADELGFVVFKKM